MMPPREQWNYVSEGETVAGPIKLDAAPSIGWPVTIVGGGFGPAQEFVVASVDEERRIVNLQRNPGA